MTVSTIVPVNNHVGNNSCTKFDFDFLIQNQNELQVSLTDKNGIVSILQYGIDYSVNEIGNENGSYITFPISSSSFGVLTPDETITLSLSLQIKQESQFENSANLDLSILEQTFDYIVRVLQILDRKIERCVKINEGVEINPDKLMEQINDNALVALKAAETSANAANIADASKSVVLEKLDYVETFSENTINELLEKGIETRAKVDFSNLTEQAEKHFLNKSQITNCLTEIPQRIKWSFSNGVFTLKSGSEVVFPNGFEEDGVTPKYDYITIENDLTFSNSGGTGIYSLVYNANKNVVSSTIFPSSSGNDIPTPSSSYKLYYNISTNKILFDNGSWTEGFSFPIALLNTQDGVPISVYQLFNGIGYIGSTIWVDKNIKCLIPNGKNYDGSLNNTEFVTNKLFTFTVSRQVSRCVVLGTNNEGTDILSVYEGNNYNLETNYNYSNAYAIQTVSRIADVLVNSNLQIISFKPKTTFQVLDESMPHVIDAYQNGASWYRVWSDGWCEQGGIANSTTQQVNITLLKNYKDTNYSPIAISNVSGGASNYNSSVSHLTTSSFQFNSMINKACICFWEAKGYIK